jgi:hypothetical protein
VKVEVDPLIQEREEGIKIRKEVFKDTRNVLHPLEEAPSSYYAKA